MVTKKRRVLLYKRKDDRPNPWCVSYRLPGGRRIRKAVSHRKDVAEVIAGQIEEQLNQGRYDPQLMTVSEFLREFLSGVEAERSHRTFQGYRQTCDAFSKDYGALLLANVTPGDVQQFLLSLSGKASATKARQLRELSAAFNSALKWGYIERNPCKAVHVPRTPQNPPRILDKTEARRLLEAAEDTPFYGVIAVALYAGLRREEIVWLEWDDVDLEKGQIYVRNKAGHPLKDYEARTVPMPPGLVVILSTLERQGNWVFVSSKGARRSADQLSRRLKPIFRKAGIEGGLHRLRHTYASHLVMAGVDLVSVQKLLGHSNITTTMIYAHVAQDHLKEQVKKLRY